MALSAGIFYVGSALRSSACFPGVAQAWPTKKIAAFGALVTVTAYYLISGFGVSAERAFIMMAIMLVAVLFDRPSISLRNVALSAIVILILSPSQVLGPSFQMSYAATLALVSGYSLWTRRPHRESVLSQFQIMRPLLFVSRFFGGILSTSFIGGVSTAIVLDRAFSPVDDIWSRRQSGGHASRLLHRHAVWHGGDAVDAISASTCFLWKVTGVGLDIVIVIAKTVAAWGGNIRFGRLPVWYVSDGDSRLLVDDAVAHAAATRGCTSDPRFDRSRGAEPRCRRNRI